MNLLSSMTMSAAPGYPLVHQRRRWTQEEDRYLADQVRHYVQSELSVDWRKVSQGLANRSNKDCRKRWLKIDKRWNQGQWSKAEDDRLRSGVNQFNTRWKAVSDVVETRNPDQCAKRWRNALDPTLQRGEWTSNDDENLLLAVSEKGRNWKEIVKENFPGRSRLDLSNRYTMLTRKKRPSHRRTLSSASRRSVSSSPDEDSSSSESHDSPMPESSDAVISSNENLAWTRSFSQPAFQSIAPTMHSPFPSELTRSDSSMHHQSLYKPAIKVEEWDVSALAMSQGSVQPPIHAGNHANTVYSPSFIPWQNEWSDTKASNSDSAQVYSTAYSHHNHHNTYGVENDQMISQCESANLEENGSTGQRTISLSNVDESTCAAILDVLYKGKKRVSLVIE